jgi:hypothetical protein
VTDPAHVGESVVMFVYVGMLEVFVYIPVFELVVTIAGLGPVQLVIVSDDIVGNGSGTIVVVVVEVVVVEFQSGVVEFV